MSIKMMFSAMNIETGSPITKLVLLKLADNADDSGKCWPSHETIARICEISVKTSQRHTKALVDLGLLKVNQIRSSNGGYKNVYHLTLDQSIATISPKHGVRESPSMATESRYNLSVESVNKPINACSANKPCFLDQRNKAFEHFWQTWSSAKKEIGFNNTAPKQKTKEKFMKIFTDSYVDKLGIDKFSAEINVMCQFITFAHENSITVNSAFFNFKSMYPAKFLTNKQWRETESYAEVME